MIFLLLILLISGANFPHLCAETSPSCYVENRVTDETRRYDTFVKAIKLLRNRKAKVIVETGTSRNGDRNCNGDGCSTLIFASWAKDHDVAFYTVDIDKDALLNAENALGEDATVVNFIHSDSIAFLRDFNQTIDFLYLDSYDFDCEAPEASQEHHLREIEAAYPWLSNKSVVMIDDCDLPHSGKGKLVIEFLLERDWQIIMSDYQVILTRKRKQS